MGLRVRHKKVATLPNGPDPQKVRSSDWNDDHNLEGKLSIDDLDTSNAPAANKYLRGDGSWQQVTASGDSYSFEETTPSLLWIVNHNLTRFVAVTVTDLAGNEIGCDVQRTTLDQVRVIFATPTAGRALIR